MADGTASSSSNSTPPHIVPLPGLISQATLLSPQPTLIPTPSVDVLASLSILALLVAILATQLAQKQDSPAPQLLRLLGLIL
ncbi:hypothetical protein BDZ94DRAFT_1268495 [Collybia nuda]|uniref:Uncharacterized protein n=1 Tax=Collybia nuda TaxID=64659 RepID=A0A9P6CBD8_9AGAR|nr:hypothetical protein BDZ94DRAFT_1268495 [Collybia nuda]